MTEAEWLTSDDPRRMIQQLGLWLDLRKARCFTREVLTPHLPQVFDEDDAERAAAVMGTLDRWAEGPEGASPDQPAGRLPAFVRGLRARRAPEFPLIIAQRLGLPSPPRGDWRPIDPRHPDRWLVHRVIRIGPPERMSGLLRDIFGNPFRPVAFRPEWRTSTVLALAEQMYDTRDFSAMPILADALQDAGCTDEAILSHCRGGGPHARGCLCVDAILDK